MAENYIVSARKYRPQIFDTVVGQEHITTTLKNAIRNNHLAHAYLFCGPRGVGKTTCARILAKTINCQNPLPSMEACDECPSCMSFRNNASFNIFELDAASNNSVDDIRELNGQVRFAPQQGKYKIYIIDEVHMLTTQAFNAFLKTLEEPPSYAVFILATTEKHKVLPTILSRCQIFDFKRITSESVVGHLQNIAAKESMEAEEAALHIIAQKSEGCMRDALSMLDRIASFTEGKLTYASTMEHLNMLDADFYFSLTDCLLSQDAGGALLLLDSVLDRGFDGNVVLEGLAGHFRNLLICKDKRMVRLLDVPNDHKSVYFEKANQSPASFILSGLNILNDAELNYRNAENKRLHVELALIRLCYVLQAINPEELKKKSEPESSAGVKLLKQSAEKIQKPESPFQNASSPHSKEPASENQNPVPTQNPVSGRPPAAMSYSQEQTPIPADPAPERKPAGNGRRISKSLMDDIEEAVNHAAASKMEKKELTDELIQGVYENYKQILKQENKSVYYAQFSMMKAEVAGEDEIKIIAPNELTEEYAKEQRNPLIDFFRKHTGIMVRVTTEVRREENETEMPQQKILSKNEVFELMAGKNPNLQLLKDALNLQIDY